MPHWHQMMTQTHPQTVGQFSKKNHIFKSFQVPLISVKWVDSGQSPTPLPAMRHTHHAYKKAHNYLLYASACMWRKANALSERRACS